MVRSSCDTLYIYSAQQLFTVVRLTVIKKNVPLSCYRAAGLLLLRHEIHIMRRSFYSLLTYFAPLNNKTVVLMPFLLFSVCMGVWVCVCECVLWVTTHSTHSQTHTHTPMHTRVVARARARVCVCVCVCGCVFVGARCGWVVTWVFGCVCLCVSTNNLKNFMTVHIFVC